MPSRAVVAVRRGPPDVLEIHERDIAEPAPGEVLVRILSSTVSQPDVQARYGRSPFPPRVPFVPGYVYVGDVDAVGAGASGTAVGDRVGVLAITGGYAEHAVVDGRKLIPVPRTLDPGVAATLILDYLVAYQVLHRVARVEAGQTVLIVGASGGIGTALVELGRLAGLTMYGLASAAKHDPVRDLGATPLDYRSDDWVETLRQSVPGGLDAVLDGVGGAYVGLGHRLLRPGGVHVAYGNPLSLGGLGRLLLRVTRARLAPGGRRIRLYGTTSSLRNRGPYEEDWATLFGLLEQGAIEPVIHRRFPLLDARAANELLETGAVVGHLVLDADVEASARSA